MTDQPLTAVLTVTIKTRPGGDYYYDHDDLIANVIPWVEGSLDDRDDITEVTVTALPAVSLPPATNQTDDWPSRRAGLRDQLINALGQITVIPPAAHRRAQADNVLALLYREWPWLRAEAEDDRAEAEFRRSAEDLNSSTASSGSPERPAAARTDLRDLIADALKGVRVWRTIDGCGGWEYAGTEALAAALVAVLPADQRAAVARVRALRQQYRFAGDDTTDYCAHCNQISGGWIPWPCPTVQALDGEARRVAGEEQPEAPWATDGARIGRVLIWSHADVGHSDFGRGYRTAQEDVRAILTRPLFAAGTEHQPGAASAVPAAPQTESPS